MVHPGGMTNRISPSSPPLALALFLALLFGGCAQTYHGVVPSELGRPPAGEASLGTPLARALANLSVPGPIRFRKLVAADWKVSRGGLINLKHARAKAAGLKDEPEPIQVYFYELEHPERGAFLIDSGVARSVRQRRPDMPVKFPVSAVMPMDDLVVHLDTKTYLSKRTTPLAGVFLTHLHLDHVLGLEDIPKDVPLYIGPGEAKDARLTHPLMRPTLAANLRGFGPLRELSVRRRRGDVLGSVDILGDGSLIGIHAPGHTKGNMAFLVRSTQGPKLLVGDGSHTAWGWDHGVPPGTFNTNGAEAAASLAALRALALRHPGLEIHLGHQHLPVER